MGKRKQKNHKLYPKNNFEALFKLKEDLANDCVEEEEIVYVPPKKELFSTKKSKEGKGLHKIQNEEYSNSAGSKEKDDLAMEIMLDYMENASINEDFDIDPDLNYLSLEGSVSNGSEGIQDDSDADDGTEESISDFNGNNFVDDFLFSDSETATTTNFSGNLGKELNYKSRQEKLSKKQNLAKLPKSKSTKKKKNREVQTVINFRQVNRLMKSFINESEYESMPLEPMKKEFRIVVHNLARCYNLKCKSAGSGYSRYPVLHKCRDTRIPKDFRMIDSILFHSEHQSNNSPSSYKSKPGLPQQSTKPYKEQCSKRFLFLAVIADKANPIDELNVGNQLLRKLGWSPGKGLGSNQDGIMNPVEAIYKSSKKGLGL